MRAFASLRRGGEFSRLRQRGRRTATDVATFFSDRARPADARSVVGITVNKAVGKAVVRNRVRRRLSAIAHEMLKRRPPLRLLIVARPASASAAFDLLRERVREALR